MDDPIAIPIYVAIASYLVCIPGSLMSTRRRTVIAFGAIGALLSALSIAGFSYMFHAIEVGMGGTSDEYWYVVPTILCILMVVPFVLTTVFRLSSIRRKTDSSNTKMRAD
jgi:uncharacterized membrane protein